tara:strand:- start:45 stop:383 length:339 start_codon:yes stop_codon:yes gene_type:complete
MHTFMMHDKKRQPFGAPVPYTPIIFLAGTTTHRLALHREAGAAPASYREWAVSHPIIGAKVCRVTGTVKGVPVSSRHLTTKQARAAAMAQIAAMCERIGSNKFNATIAAVQS